jgi:hypothetical protein
VAEGVLARRRLGLANEDHDVPLAGRIMPDKKAAAGEAAGADQARLYFGVLDLEQAQRRELGLDVHAELGHQEVTRADRDVAHSRPDGDEARVIEFFSFGHDGTPVCR